MSSSNFKDLTGMTFNRLTVIERAPNKGKQTMWRCLCDCGNVCIVRCDHLKDGHTKSCGCYNHEVVTKHGIYNTKIYHTWEGIHARCYNPNNEQYPNYGGRGIKVCERWHVFDNFYDDVSILPHFGEKGYTLDRIDVNGDYCPENCRWATQKQQCNNRRNNVKVVYKGEVMTTAEAAEKSGVNYATLKSRYRVGKRGEELFVPVKRKDPHNKKRQIEF